MKIRSLRQTALLLSLLVTAGCDSGNEKPAEPKRESRRQREGNPPARDASVPAAATPRFEHGPEAVKLAQDFLGEHISLETWWDGMSSDAERKDVILALFDTNPEFAINLIEATPGDRMGINLREWLVGAWANANPSQCYQWIRDTGNLNPAQRNLLIRHLASRARMVINRMNSTPEPWLVLLGDMKRNQTHERTLFEVESTLASHFSRNLPITELLAKMESAGPLTQRGLHYLFEAAAERDIEDTLSFLDTRPADKTAWLQARGDVRCVQIMGRTSPSRAFEWALERDTADSLERSVKAAVSAWLPVSSRAASTRIAEMPPGDAKDAAIGVMVQWLHKMDSTHEALPWLESVTSEVLRQEYQELLRE